MEPNCLGKVVSLHMERCSFECPNSDVCYHIRKSTLSSNAEGVLPTNFREELLELGYTIHESVCDASQLGSKFLLLTKYKNYNITLSYAIFIRYPELHQFKDQVQVTVYTSEQARAILEHQKLFLIKDDDTFAYSVVRKMFGAPFKSTHFCVNQDWLDKKKLEQLVTLKMFSNTTETTLDSCLESHLINGICPYSYGNYIDITYDGTLRTCPFNVYGIDLKDVFTGDYDALFKIKISPEKCRYADIIEELNGSNKHTSISSNSSNN